VLVQAGRLADAGKPYALATVIRVVRPASTRRGDRALVTPDGALAGWVGGACSEPIVVREALRALADGEPRLVRIGPAGSGVGAPDDVVVAESRCASEGVVEVLIEPELPGPLLAGVGEADLARVRSPAGRDLGPSTQEEIAVAILAELVDWRHGLAGAAQAIPAGVASTGVTPAEAVDPVCGMTVAVAGVPTAVRDGVTWYFCSVGCRDHFERTGGGP
jgi:xanthine/CO dehydrogenase XdhC/CoxF family maturation factor/YHS domain-containing protein